MRVLILQHDPADGPMRLGEWLAAAGADADVLRLDLGRPVPADLSGYRAVISLGGEMGALDDDKAPWLPATRRLLARAVADDTPTLGICLGAQLLAVACGGTVRPGPDGPEIGAYLAAKRDAAEKDPLFGALPMTPDVLQYHYDVVDPLPPGAELLLSSPGYPHQAFRVGRSAWGLQFHIEPGAAELRAWAAGEGIAATGRLGPALDEAVELMDIVWRAFVDRFVRYAEHRAAAGGLTHRPLPLLPADGHGHRT